MSQEQMPARVTVPEDKLPTKNEVIPQGLEAEVKLKPPLVSEEDLKRMHAQIAEVFENSTHLPEKTGEWQAETGMGEQVANVAWFGLKHPLLTGKLLGKGISHLFKNKKPRSQVKDTHNQTQDA